VLAVVGVSGAHLNPAVSLALAVHGKFSFAKLPYYCLAQILGAFFGGTLVFFNYYNYFEYWSGRFDQDMRVTQLGSIFTSFPDPVVSNLESYFDNFIASFLLLFCIAIFTDKRNMHSDKMFIPVHLAMAITMIGGTLSLNCGSAANPAIDFGGR
jgi:aquaglyceroporin related protein